MQALAWGFWYSIVDIEIYWEGFGLGLSCYSDLKLHMLLELALDIISQVARDYRDWKGFMCMETRGCDCGRGLFRQASIKYSGRRTI